MCALFWARGAERYLRDGGTLALVLPYAALNAPVFAGMRDGSMQRVRVAITGGWGLERVWPIFGAQSGSSTTSTCVLFGERDRAGRPAGGDRSLGGRASPARCQRGRGGRGARTCAGGMAKAANADCRFALPQALSAGRDASTPRRFFLVEHAAAGRLQSRRDAPRVRGRVGNLDKRPWTSVEPPEGPVERAFVRRIALGEFVAPYRVLDLVTGVVPMEDGAILTSASADAHGHRGLAAWLRDAEAKWNEHSNKDADGDASRFAGAVAEPSAKADGAGNAIADARSLHQGRNAAERMLARR